MDRKEILHILASAGQRPKHQFGQNFMVDQNILHAIVDAGDIGPNDVILEVGPGVGNLTRLLAAKAAAVLAVDIDKHLLPAAQAHHRHLTNITWLLADVLASKHQVEPTVLESLRNLRTQHPNGNLKLVSNLPYNAASPLIAELLVEMWKELQQDVPPKITFERFIFTVQYEVALRMTCQPNTRDYGPLGILIQLTADAQILRKIPPGAFWPPPKINSALVHVTPQPDRIKKIPDAPTLQKLLAGLFSHRRQTLGNALKHHLGDKWQPEFKRQFSAQNFDLLQRAESLPPTELLRLQTVITQLLTPGAMLMKS